MSSNGNAAGHRYPAAVTTTAGATVCVAALGDHAALLAARLRSGTPVVPVLPYREKFRFSVNPSGPVRLVCDLRKVGHDRKLFAEVSVS